MLLANSPQIARLFGHPRRWASRRVKAGKYGPVTRARGKSHWVHLDTVAAIEGATFSAAQLTAAGIRIPKPIEEAA